MENDTLLNLYNQVLAASNAGDDPRAQILLKDGFAQLSEDVQGEIITHLYFQSIQEEVQEAEAIADVQGRALAVLDALEILKKKIEEGSGTDVALT